MDIESPEGADALHHQLVYDGKLPSPTSRLGMNVRYFHIDDPLTHLSADVDIGKDAEDMLEEVFITRCGGIEKARTSNGRLGYQALLRLSITSGMNADLNVWPFALMVTASTGNQLPTQLIEKHRERIIDTITQVLDGIDEQGRPIPIRQRPSKFQ